MSLLFLVLIVAPIVWFFLYCFASAFREERYKQQARAEHAREMADRAEIERLQLEARNYALQRRREIAKLNRR